MRDREYNGWTNYETWLVNMWMDNDQGSQDYYGSYALQVYEEASDQPPLTREEHARLRFADWLKEHHEENMPELPGVYGDLLRGALSEVNWCEIARHYIEAVQEEEADA